MIEKLEIASVPIIGADGSRLATLVITSDTEHTGVAETAPLIRVSPEAASESFETELQLRESARYYYDVELPDPTRDLRLRSKLSKRRGNLRPAQADSGRIETGNFCGTALFDLVDGDANDHTKQPVASLLLEVRSVKLNYRTEYRGMLRTIAARMADLIADARSSAKAPFASTFEERHDKGWFQIQLEFLREILESEDFRAALQRVTSYPHERLEQEQEDRPIEQTFKCSPRAVRQLINAPNRRLLRPGDPITALTGLRSVASRIMVTRKTPTLDTPENRFVKHALMEFLAFLSHAQQVFEAAESDWLPSAGLAKRLAISLERWITRPLFKALKPAATIPIGSPVLQRKPGYREILRSWLRFRTAAELSWRGGEDLFRAGQRSVAELYEYWLFFALLDWFYKRFTPSGTMPILTQLLDGLDTDSPRLKLKKRIPLGPFVGTFSDPRRRLYATLFYNRDFAATQERRSTGSWTRKMHPDYTLTFWPAIDGMSATEAERIAEEQELLVHIHFDAKYRLENIDGILGVPSDDDIAEEDPTSPGNYKHQDLLKMHAYRDAIKRSEGAYVLYPGDDACRRGQFDPLETGRRRWPHTMFGFHEILPGLGAFAIAPDQNGDPKGIEHLSRFLEEVLENLCNRATLRERRSSMLYEALREDRALASYGSALDMGGLMLQDAPELDADKLRLPAAPDIVTLVAWFDSVAQKEWMLNKSKIVLRLGNRRGSLPLIKSLAVASHVLLRGRRHDVVKGLLRITAAVGQVLTRAELRAQGFPADTSKPANDIFAVFSVARDDTFASMQFDGRKLNAAIVNYLNRQRPSYKKQLTALRRDIAKPQLVSLADLQLALQEA